jgi:hypothetical protein
MIQTTTFKYLLRGAGRGEPEPAGVGGDADHGAAGHEVANGVGPPGVVVPLVHQVLPCHQLQHSSFVGHYMYLRDIHKSRVGRKNFTVSENFRSLMA